MPGGFPGDEPIGIERGISDNDFDFLFRNLAPYAFGQVMVTRRFNGQVFIGGSPLEETDRVATEHAERRRS